MPYKGVNIAARPPGGSPAEVESLTAASLPLFLLGEPRSEPKSRTGSEVLLGKKLAVYLPTSLTRQGLTQGQKPEGRLKWG